MTARSQGFGSGPVAGALTGRSAFPAARSARVEPSALPAGIGVTLREAREARGLSYAEAERVTHIPRHHLQALEEERFDAFSARVYVRGFLRSYAQYLGLDAAELLALLSPDGPVEEDRLLPLSRLGRPRGPREAARARRHPIERDAPPLTDAALADAEREWPPTTPRLSFDAAPAAPHSERRIDPLGRLGWPAGPEDYAPTPPEPAERPLYESDADPVRRAENPRFARLRRGRPLAQEHASRDPVAAPILDSVPDDVRPLFSRRALPGVLAVVLALFVFYALVTALGGGDTSPAVLASAATGIAPAIATAVPAAPSVARGSMLDVHGRDLASAESALEQLGIVPTVVEQTSGTGFNGQVIAQTPAPGAPLRSDTPVLLVIGQP